MTDRLKEFDALSYSETRSDVTQSGRNAIFGFPAISEIHFDGRMAKRGLDVIITLLLLPVAIPILVCFAIAVFIVSPGQPFFSQVREGIGGKPIRIWKIRTMATDAQSQLERYLAANPTAEREYATTFKLRADPRVIPKLGHLLRSSSIDELPQLWNVLTGEMSLVGPRAMPSLEVEHYSERGRALRRSVPPGITGFWQIKYRNDSDLNIREKADIYYVRKWSLGLDFWILLRTVKVVVSRSGAY